MATVKAVCFLPLKDNNSRPLTAEIQEARDEFYARFHGWTREGDVTGAFRMADGSQALDDSQKYMIALEEDELPELEQILRDFKAKTQQEAIYLEIHRAVEVRLV